MADSDTEFYYILMQSDRRNREKEKERESKKNSSFLESPPHRRDSTTTRHSPGPSSSRRSTFDSVTDGAGATRRGRSPALSSTSDQLEKLRKDNPYRTKDLPTSRRDYPSSTSRRSDKERAGKTPPAVSHASETRRSIARPPSTLPPEPSKPPPPPPPPPPLPEVPRLPSFAVNQQMTSSGETTSRALKELSIDEQRLAWHQRIEYAHIMLVLVQ